VFGYEEEPAQSNTGEQIKDMIRNYGGKLKDKAGSLITKLKNDWESN